MLLEVQQNSKKHGGIAVRIATPHLLDSILRSSPIARHRHLGATTRLVCVCWGAMFEKTLQDVVKGIRANKRDPSDYISATIAEIKVELKSSDAFIKAQAVSDQIRSSAEGNRDGTVRGTSRMQRGITGCWKALQ